MALDQSALTELWMIPALRPPSQECRRGGHNVDVVPALCDTDVNAGRKLRGDRRSKTARSAALCRGHHLLPSVLEPVAVALEDDDFGVVHQAVDHGGDGNCVVEDLGPGGEAAV
jgi:hypothetical protein